jgi:putative ABC transport system permease protein
MVGVPLGKSALRRKLLRDIRLSAMQFVAIVLLCALGTWVYSGLDGTWRMISVSAETYFTQAKLADYWVNVQSATRADVENLQNISGVETVQSRFSAEFDTPALGAEASLMVHAYDGAPQVNLPVLRAGEALLPNDRRGLLLDERFAAAHGLAAGDGITLQLNKVDYHFTVRGLILSPEQVVTAKDVMPEPERYGYAVLNLSALQGFPVNELVVKLQSGADAAAALTAIQARLPAALVLTQQTHPSTQRTRSEVAMFQNLTYVFPVLAFAVAAMIVLTTLTRMIEYQRTQIGTLKALGYGKNRIRAHYLNYAFLPSLLGALGGLFVGRYMLPDMLYNMEEAHYALLDKIRPPISLPAWGMTALMVLLSVFICLYTYQRAAREEAAALLRPKPPRAGSRVFLERLTGLWRRFSFNTKMIVRGIARNKGRTMVSMVGLMCCNALIICAMGLNDSIAANVGDYYHGTVAYTLRADLDGGAGTLESYQKRVDAARVEGVMEMRVSLRYAGQSRAVPLNVLMDGQQLLRLGPNNAVVPLPQSGIAISRKLADITGLAAGDTVEVWLPGEDRGTAFAIDTVYEVTIGQTVYMSQTVWDGMNKGPFTPTALFVKDPTPLAVHRLAEAKEVTGFKEPDTQYALTMTVLDSTTAVFSLMYAAALGLAFVICYNMGLINFTERTRDYATLKVLGYHQKEIRSLMMRENNIVTVIGAALGIWPGVLLTQAVLMTVRSENNVFVAQVSPLSMLVATLITCVFSILIELFLTRRVRSINMVEALKSVE